MKQNKTLLKTQKALLTLMEKQNFDEIKVTDISAACGFSRQNFYKNFENKYELAHKIFLHDLCSALSKTMLFDFEVSTANVLSELKRNKAFYLGILRSKAGEYMYNLIFDYTVAAFEEFSRYSSFRLLSDEEKQKLRLFASGLVMFSVRFISGEEQSDAKTIAGLLKNSIPKDFERLVQIEGITSEFIIYKAVKFSESMFFG